MMGLFTSPTYCRESHSIVVVTAATVYFEAGELYGVWYTAD